MRIKYIALLIIFNFATCAFAQKQGYVWYFARQLGLDFNTTPPNVLLDGQIDHTVDPNGHTEGTASIASANGELLFYANGYSIWNRKHEIMKNGSGLVGHPSSTNGAVIIPMPGQNAKYYVFTTHAWQLDLPYGLHYSIVDMCDDNGYGEVMASFKNIQVLEGAGERLAVTRHANGVDYWLVAHKHFSSAFHAYLITESGISAEVVSDIGTFHGRDGYMDAIGQMKISPDGTRLALVMANRSPDVVDLFDFDPASGKLTGYLDLSTGAITGGLYGVTFSPDGSKLYVNGNHGLYQYSLDADTGTQEEIVQSRFKIPTNVTVATGLQLGPDEKIYVVRVYDAGIIQNPNLAGAACEFEDGAIFFKDRAVTYAFPTFIDNFEYPDKGSVLAVNVEDEIIFCPGASTTIDATSSGENLRYLWQDGSTNPIYEVSAAGTYSVRISDKFCTVEKTIVATESAIGTKIDLAKDTVLCFGSSLRIDLDPNLNYYWSDGSTDNFKIVNDPVVLWVNALTGNCQSSDSIKVDFVNCELRLPNFFSPDGNEYNPSFIPSEMSGVTSAQLSVYNRWGKEIYHTDDFSILNGWDGTQHNEPVSSGTYFWHVEYIDIDKNARTLKGILTLRR
ncbi:MAG: gliding motility-associated C-terminal domain-containing protein [Cyclobacteriaceae bacterium]